MFDPTLVDRESRAQAAICGQTRTHGQEMRQDVAVLFAKCCFISRVHSSMLPSLS